LLIEVIYLCCSGLRIRVAPGIDLPFLLLHVARS
jgi:hypothetical protein